MKKLLFILKKRETTYGEICTVSPNKYCISTGLLNSARFVVDMLNRHSAEANVEANLVIVTDNNDIDREVTKYKPTHVIIEAYWVVPEKFDVLQKLHPDVTWIVRNHSEIPFLVNEGVAVDWTLKYVTKPNVLVAPNSPRSFDDIYKMVEAAYGELVALQKVIYLPNYYTIKRDFVKHKKLGETINVGCFGAIRPLKNHMLQAIAAVDFALGHGKKLNFHVNAVRLEDHGNSVLKSLRSYFDKLPDDYKLVEHGWLDHDDFLDLVSTMDIGLQVSMTESFNIISADFVSLGIPIIASKEVFWLPHNHFAEPTSSGSIEKAMEDNLFCLFKKCKKIKALQVLNKYNEDSVSEWLNQFGD